MAAKVQTKVVGRTTKGGETFLKVSVSGRARWVSERGYAQMQKMVREGATALQVRKAMQSYTQRKTLGYRENIKVKDSAGIVTTKRVAHLGKKTTMIRNLARAMEKTGVPVSTRRDIVKQLKGMSEKEIYDFFQEPDNQKYLDVSFKYKETDDDGRNISLDDPQASNRDIETFQKLKKRNAVSLLSKLRAFAALAV